MSQFAHFLDGHRRSRLYRAAIINPNRVPVKVVPKSKNRRISLFKYSGECERQSLSLARSAAAARPV